MYVWATLFESGFLVALNSGYFQPTLMFYTEKVTCSNRVSPTTNRV